MNFRIEPEFENYLPGKLSDIQRDELEKSIVKEGCRDPLVIWAGENILIDGHNRYKICFKYKIPFQTVTREFDSDNEAKLWMLLNQGNRRNNTEEELILMMGMAVELQKKSHSEAGSMKGKSKGQNVLSSNTYEEVGKKFGKSAKAAQRAAEVTAAVENLTKKIDPTFKGRFASGDHPSKTAIIKATQVVEESPEIAKKILSGEYQDDVTTPLLAVESSLTRNSIVKLVAAACFEFKGNLQNKCFTKSSLKTLDAEGGKALNKILNEMINKLEEYQAQIERVGK